MNTFIALLRGINVGGNNILPMRNLVELLEGLGLSRVKTYIQSGNAVFQSKNKNSAQLSQEISAAIGERFGFTPQVMVLEMKVLQNAIISNPFPEGESEPKTLHLFFLVDVPQHPDLEILESLKANSEQFMLTNSVFYLYAPNGIGRSKLAAKVEKALGVAVTARNWRTVNKIMDIALKVA